MTGLPCHHAIAVIVTFNGVKWEHYCSDYFNIQKFKEANALSISPPLDKKEWQYVEFPYSLKPPHTIRPPGRPKKKRIRDKDEKKKSRKHRYNKCFKFGHHKTPCKEDINPRVLLLGVNHRLKLLRVNHKPNQWLNQLIYPRFQQTQQVFLALEGIHLFIGFIFL